MSDQHDNPWSNSVWDNEQGYWNSVREQQQQQEAQNRADRENERRDYDRRVRDWEQYSHYRKHGQGGNSGCAAIVVFAISLSGLITWTSSLAFQWLV